MPRRTQIRAAALCCAAIAALGCLSAVAETRPGVIYARLEHLYAEHVRDGWVNYQGLARPPAFEIALAGIADVRLKHLKSRADRLAFWINAYNALAIKGILDGYSPTDFIGRYQYFKRNTYRVARQTLTLDFIEHKILRPMGEPRVHFALVCASSSCPKLPSRVFWPETIDEQLDAATRAFINDESRNRFAHGERVARVSKIFKWFDEDFEAAAGSVQRYLSQYVADPEIAAALGAGSFKIKYLPYVWDLNGNSPLGEPVDFTTNR